MAEKRSTADSTGTAVPKARTPDVAGDPSTEPASGSAGGPAGGARPRKAPVKKAPVKKATAKKAPVKKAIAEKGAAGKARAEQAAPARAPSPKAAPAAAPAKAAPTKAPNQPARAVDAAAPTAGPAIPGAAAPPASPAAPGAWLAAAAEAVQQPDQPPHRIAELAVAELGPRAAAWVGWLRATYPDPPATGMVRLAGHEARRTGWALAASEAGGPVAAAFGLPASAWVRASLVLRIAAARGHDPADPRRAGELLELLGMRPSGQAPARTPERAGEWARPARLVGAVGRSGLTRLAVRRLRLGRTLAAAAVRVLVAASDHGERLDRLAHRADRFYRRPR